MSIVKNYRPKAHNSNNSNWDTWFNSFLNDPMWFHTKPATNRFSTPAVNIVNLNDDGFRVDVAAPGLEKEDFKVELDKQKLTISADLKKEESETTETFTRKEFNYSSFERVFDLPETIDGEKIRAEYKSGVLSIFLPKKEEAKEKPARAIEIE